MLYSLWKWKKSEKLKQKWTNRMYSSLLWPFSAISFSYLWPIRGQYSGHVASTDQPEDLWLCLIKPSDPVSVMSTKHKFCSVQCLWREKERDVFFSYGASISVILWNGQLKMREKERGSESQLSEEKNKERSWESNLYKIFFDRMFHGHKV